MNTRCYFNIHDVCVAYDLGELTMSLGGDHQMVDSGLYEFAFGYNPLGKTAEELYMYSALTPA